MTKHGDDAAEREEVAAVAKKHGMTSPSFLDVDGAWSKASGLGNNPSYLVLGRDGKAVYRFAGKLTEGTADFDALSKAIEEALAAKS